MGKNPYQMEDERLVDDDVRVDSSENDRGRDEPEARSAYQNDGQESKPKSGCGKWGCCCLFILLFALSTCGGVAVFAYNWIKDSPPIQETLNVAAQHPEVQEQLGVPLEMTWLFSGNISFNNDDGEASVSIPVGGPKGQGVIWVEAMLTDGDWKFTKMLCVVDGTGNQIDLLPSAKSILNLRTVKELDEPVENPEPEPAP